MREGIKVEPLDFHKHITQVCFSIRVSDALELMGVSGLLPHQVMLAGEQNLLGGRAITYKGVAIAVFGLSASSTFSDEVYPWLIASNQVYAHRLSFLRTVKKLFKFYRGRYKEFVNYVDARNTESIKWLKWMGFKIEEPEPYGPYGLLYHKFTWREGWNSQQEHLH